MQVPIKPKYARSGETWVTHSVPHLYLDDIIFIYRVMNDYAEASPSFQQKKRFRQELNAFQRSQTRTNCSENEESTNSSLQAPLTLPTSVKMEAGDYIPSTIEELKSLELESATHFRMSAANGELCLWCSPWNIELDSYLNSPLTTEAFNHIQDRIQQHENHLLSGLFRFPTLGILFAVMVLAANVTLTDRWSSVLILQMGLLLAFIFGTLWHVLSWSRRRVVILDYKRNANNHWYSSDLMKVTLAAMILPALLKFLINLM